MPKGTEQPEFPNFKEAYCAYYGCKLEAFESRCFWKSLYRHAVLLAVPIWIFNRRFFHKDFDAIRGIGAARNSREFATVTGEFATVNRMESSIRRGTMRIRVSGHRLRALHDRLAPYITPQETNVFEPFVPRGAAIDVVVPHKTEDPIRKPEQTPVPRRTESPGRRTEGSALMLRKLKQAHEEITSGRPVAAVISGLGLDMESFCDALQEYQAISPGFPWLLRYVRNETRLEILESENANLLKKVATQSLEIDSLRGDATHSR